MDWRATVNLIITTCFITLMVICPNLVEGKPSLLGIEHNSIVSQSSNHHHSHGHHDDNHVSNHHGNSRDFNDLEYDNDDMTVTTSDDYYDENSDRSYKYEFDADGYRRSEESDSSGYVVGSYSFVDAEGKERSLSYRAVADIGFVPVEAEGVHPEIMAGFADFGKKHSSTDSAVPSSIPSTNSRISMPSLNRAPSNRQNTFSSPNRPSSTGYSNTKPMKPHDLYLPPTEDKRPARKETTSVHSNNNPRQGMAMFTPYSFGFNENDLLREESADSSGNVKGRYAYTNGDGNKIEVRYSAGAEKGFVIENEAELAKNVEKATKDAFSSSTNAVSSSSTILDVRQKYNQPSGKQQTNGLDSSTINFVGPNIDDATWESDGTYTFGYKTVDSERNEVADETGVVTGSYVIPDAFGQPMTVRYRAGPEIGYVVENLEEVNARSVPQPKEEDGISNVISASRRTNVVVSPPVKSQQVSPVVGSGVLPPKTSPIPTPHILYSAPSNTYETTSNKLPEDKENTDYDDYYDPDADRSYSFSYAEDRGVPGWISKRQEEADSEGKVKGRYSYVNDDGNEIAVQYVAGAGIGFVVENSDELRASVRKATEDGAAKIVKVKATKHNSKKEDSAKRRTVVRKGQRRVSHAKTKGEPADPLSIVKVSSSSRLSPIATSKTANEPSILYGVPRKSPPTPPSTLYAAPRKSTPTPPPTLYSPPKETRRSSFASFPLHDVASFIPPQVNLLDIKGKKDIDDDTTYDYYNDVDYEENQDDYYYNNEDYEYNQDDYYYNNEDYEENHDASFSFSIKSDEHTHQESSDENGERFGSYSYVSPTGETVVVKYRAGINGFEILNPEDVFPKSPAV